MTVSIPIKKNYTVNLNAEAWMVVRTSLWIDFSFSSLYTRQRGQMVSLYTVLVICACSWLVAQQVQLFSHSMSHSGALTHQRRVRGPHCFKNLVTHRAKMLWLLRDHPFRSQGFSLRDCGTGLQRTSLISGLHVIFNWYLSKKVIRWPCL